MQPTSIRKYSDRMLELEAKRRVPEYRERVQVDQKVDARTTHSGKVDVGHTHRLDLEKLTDHQIDLLEQLIASSEEEEQPEGSVH